MPTEDELAAQYIWPPVREDDILNIYLDLTRNRHGGSGLNWTKADVDDCPWDQLVKVREKLHDAFAAEAKEIKAANKKGRRK